MTVTFGKRVTEQANPAPNIGLALRMDDDADAIAQQFGDRFRCRVDPRDCETDDDNTTGIRRVHTTAPSLDPLVWNGSAFAIGTYSGLYNGLKVFKCFNSGVSGSGTANDAKVVMRSMAAVTQFSVMGVCHIGAGNYSINTGSAKPIIRARVAGVGESSLHAIFSSPTNFLVADADLGAGSAANHNLDTSTIIDPDVPFAFMWTVKTASNELFINQTTAADATEVSPDLPEAAGLIEWFLGHGDLGSDINQFLGAIARLYFFEGDIKNTAPNQTLAANLMAALKSIYGIS